MGIVSMSLPEQISKLLPVDDDVVVNLPERTLIESLDYLSREKSG